MKQFFAVLSLLFLFTIISCAAITGTQEISAADSLLRKKQYSKAAMSYREMLQQHPDSLYARDARYGLAMTLISFDNPQKDYYQALHEFEVFYKMYPNDRRLPEVENWIAALRALHDLSSNIEQLKRLDIRHEERRRR